MRWSGLAGSLGSLALLFVTASAMVHRIEGESHGDEAWRAAENRRQQLIEELKRQHELWYVQHLQAVRQTEEAQLVAEQEGAEG